MSERVFYSWTEHCISCSVLFDVGWDSLIWHHLLYYCHADVWVPQLVRHSLFYYLTPLTKCTTDIIQSWICFFATLSPTAIEEFSVFVKFSTHNVPFCFHCVFTVYTFFFWCLVVSTVIDNSYFFIPIFRRLLKDFFSFETYFLSKLIFFRTYFHCC